MSDELTFSERLFIGKQLLLFKQPDRTSTRLWAERERVLTSEVSSRPGKMNCMETPWMLYVMECLDNPEIPVIVGKKSAQIAWTETINNYIGRTIDLDPRNIMIAFPRAANVLKFYKEKLIPFIKYTPAVRNKIHGSLSRLSHKHIAFNGGFLILANIGAADDGKSSVVPIIIVEEPDGVKADVNKQGDGMAILQQRQKSFADSKLIYAGTPTDKDFSQVDLAYNRSNKGNYHVCCPSCSNLHVLTFDNLKYDVFQDRKIDDIYGIYNPETAYYQCPFCLTAWDDSDRAKAVIEGLNFFNLGWKFEIPEIKDVYGFAFKELLSTFKASSNVNLAKQKLKALHAYDQGKEGLLKSFVNNSDGEAYLPLNTGITIEELKLARLNYPETIVPYEGLILTAGIDVQHNRFAIVVRAWGKNGNSWGVHWIEIFGNVLDYGDPVWTKLTDYILQSWKHAAGSGRTLKIAAATIDTADGGTTELVYQWVSEISKVHPHILAGKGIAELKYSTYDIYNEPNVMEQGSVMQERKTLAQSMGVNVFLIGAYRAHEEILRRINLKGNRDRYYHCEFSYGNYEEQILSCRKVINENNTKGGYKLIAGKAKEAMDCEKMALHAARAIQIHNYTNKHWYAIESYLYNLNDTTEVSYAKNDSGNTSRINYN